MEIRNKKVIVLGSGKSAAASARFLRDEGAVVFVSEGLFNERTEQSAAALIQEGFEVELGSHSKTRIKESDFVVISPGIKPESEIYQFLVSENIPFFSEIEVASWFVQMPVISVTGTNGKTTVTTLIAKMLSDNDHQAISCGNIGNPLISEVKKINQQKIIPVVELSSFQLMNIKEFKPFVGVLLNLEPDHLDWHADLKEYYDAKFEMFRNQTESDYAVLNGEPAEIESRISKLKSTVKKFYGEEPGGDNPNWNACLKVGEIYNLDREKCLESLRAFKGIEHRLEKVESECGYQFINDSKSTNISSLVWALERMIEPVTLIMGGRHKGGDFGVIRDLLLQKTKHIVLMGESASLIQSALPDGIKTSKASSLEDAIETAIKVSDTKGTILFSPACASFDMFKNYDDRGKQFKTLVKQLSSKCHKTAYVS